MRAAAVAAALAAAALLPGQPLGIGVPLVALLVALAVVLAGRLTADAALFGPPALALASLAAVRDAGWVVGLDLAAAWLLASVAVAGPTPAGVASPLVRLRGAPALAPEPPAGVAPVLRGMLLGGLLTLPFGALFWSADSAFAELAGRIPRPELDSVPGRAGTFALVLAAALGLALAARSPLRARPLRVRRRLGRWEWAIPLALLDALFLAFVAVQLAVLFGGHDHVLRSAGLTYAEYARQGFWQLLAAAALTLAVVGVAVLVAETPRRADRLALRLLLAALCALTAVILASAVHRLNLYEAAFGLTRSRLAAEAFALWLGGVFALVVAAGAAARVRRRLPRILVAGTAAGLLALSLADPDRLIAARNVERWQETGRLDIAYLRGLSADAVPPLAGLPRGLRGRALPRIERGEPWSSANLSRRRARALLARWNGG